MKSLPILIFLSINYIHSLVESASECPSFQCVSEVVEKGGKCITTNEDDILDLKICPRDERCVRDDEKNIWNATCKTDPQKYSSLSLPGMKCSDKKDCLSKNCNGVCVGSDEGKKCDNSAQCNPGLFCNKSGKCEKTKNLDENCSSDEECNHPYGCLNGTCTEFLSKNISHTINNNSKFYCDSMFAYDGKCDKASLAEKSTDSCEENCNYILESNGLNVEMVNTCRCTVTRKPDKKCAFFPGQDHIGFNQVIEKLRKHLEFIYSDKNKCHPSEPRGQYCLQTLKENFSMINEEHEYKKLLIDFEHYTELNEDLPCSYQSVFGLNPSGPKLPFDNKCPTYRCAVNEKEFKFDDDTCAYSTNPFKEDGSNISVIVNNICKENSKVCKYNLSHTLDYYDFNSTCEKETDKDTWTMKYAGEKCTTRYQCIKGSFNNSGFCIDGVCSGNSAGEPCVNHTDCKKGLFCNGLMCQKQKSKNSFCIVDEECYNYLGCLNNTCTPYYSLEKDTYLNKTNYNKRFCQMGLVNEVTKQCAELDYTEEMKKKKQAEGYVECKLGEKCNYTTGFKSKKTGELLITDKDCECGFSGKSYCPLPHTVSKTYWKKYYTMKAKSYDNDCHTVRRDKCYESINDSDEDEMKDYRRKSERAHIFKDVDNCVIEVLKSLNIKVSYFNLILGLFIALL